MENAMHVPGFYGDPSDFELEKITNFLSILKDVGKILKKNSKLHNIAKLRGCETDREMGGNI